MINPDIELFLESIGHLLSMYLFPTTTLNPIQEVTFDHSILHSSSENQLALTDRQLLILRLISEGHTNSTISELLKYSESTVRQETIKIFSKLKCAGREEAGAIYLHEQRVENIA